MGRPSERATKRAVASPRSARYPPPRRRSVSSGTEAGAPGAGRASVTVGKVGVGPRWSAGRCGAEDEVAKGTARGVELALAGQLLPPGVGQIAARLGQAVEAYGDHV